MSYYFHFNIAKNEFHAQNRCPMLLIHICLLILSYLAGNQTIATPSQQESVCSEVFRTCSSDRSCKKVLKNVKTDCPAVDCYTGELDIKCLEYQKEFKKLHPSISGCSIESTCSRKCNRTLMRLSTRPCIGQGMFSLNLKILLVCQKEQHGSLFF